ncbi:hypothetical protein ACN6MY_14825 [Peribacillus sp. B-H-3]|uniref:glycosyl-4,4'-diaponeurosporenoate acyltransferase CrtO family protein n=1 Tax=Peribacillus sp. B-H-3 TaxID=3400420 RepID=UPI003B02B0E8
MKKSKINLKNKECIRLFLLETRRAEISHWIQLLPSPIFFVFNDFWAGCIMIVYALCFNLPLIAIQRYNRNRLLRISARHTRPAQLKL